MRRLFAALMLIGMLGAAPTAAGALDGVGEADRGQIRQVIEAQLAAFRRDDGVAAFGFAAPSIRALFGDPEPFMTMVRTGYAPVYRAREVEFRDLVDLDGRLTQRVLLVGPDGKVVVAHYFMERQPDGSWRISGCVLKGSEQSVS
jgi:hypothetical protein